MCCVLSLDHTHLCLNILFSKVHVCVCVCVCFVYLQFLLICNGENTLLKLLNWNILSVLCASSCINAIIIILLLFIFHWWSCACVSMLQLYSVSCCRYLMYTLDKFVEEDYSLVYFHYGLTSKNKPPLSWLWQAYRAFDRKYKKNLKALYLVHPTNFIRVIWQIFKAAIRCVICQPQPYLTLFCIDFSVVSYFYMQIFKFW